VTRPVHPPADDGLFEELFATAARESARDGEGVELYERRGAALELSADDDGERVLVSHERGFALRLVRSGRVAFAAATPASAAGLLEAARRSLPRARTRRGARAAPPIPGDTQTRRPAETPAIPSEEAAHELLAAFRRFLAASGEGAVALLEATVSVGERSERVATSAGRDAAWTAGAASLVGTVAGRSGAGRFSARVVAAAARPEELPLARLARYGADRVLLPLHGRPLDGARRDLLLDSHVAAHLVGRLAPLFLGDGAEPLLAARTRDGRDPLAAPVLSLVDDAAATGGPVRTPRDAEGTPQRRHVVVERGVPVSRLTDTTSAARRGAESSGNAVRRAWSEPPVLGVSNFFVDPSAGLAPLELLSPVARGFYAAILLERPSVDVAADRFRLSVGGYLVERGRATGRVSEAVVSGRISDILRRIEAVGDDLRFVSGAGGGIGSPTLLIPRWKSE
jgi:PmbA protein